MMINFYKMQGLGNDFVIIDNRTKLLNLSYEQIIKICDRKFGIGCDQLIILEPTKTDADVLMIIYNQDGSKALACGNANRCVGKLLATQLNKKTIQIINQANDVFIVDVENDNSIKSTLPAPKFKWNQIPLANEVNNEYIIFEDIPNLPKGFYVNVGNPHIIFFVENIQTFNIEYYGKIIESHKIFPERVNVNFAQIINDRTVDLITYERGVGITLACGTGACATAVSAIKHKLLKNDLIIRMKGGDLKINWYNNEIEMIGNAGFVFTGQIEI
ncbi:MAG: diaminopimelate epimerase [Sphingobacteriia bacterium]|nr:diaminopimelate epimerase [Sphingobacteriia bacterium]